MNVVCDAHLHLYPCYDLAEAFQSLERNLSSLSSAETRTAFLAERRDCRFFDRLRDGGIGVEGWDIERHDDAVAVAREGRRVWLFAGRQVVTRERLEVAAMGTDRRVPDGMPMDETLRAIRETGAVPALNWAPGKWFFGRGRVVGELLERTAPGDLLLCDSSLRPRGWGEPVLMRVAAERGFTVVAGSDPLPLAGEERNMGRYGFECDCELDPVAPAASVLGSLRAGDVRISRTGRRGGPLETAVRLARNEYARRTGR